MNFLILYNIKTDLFYISSGTSDDYYSSLLMKIQNYRKGIIDPIPDYLIAEFNDLEESEKFIKEIQK